MNQAETYKVDKPCKNGHFSERYVTSKRCVQCCKNNAKKHRTAIYSRVKEWRKNNPEARTEESRRYAAKYPGNLKKKALAYRERNLKKIRERDKKAKAQSRQNNPEAQRLRTERFKAKQAQKRAEEAGRPMPEVCEVCSELHIRIVFDHCHVSDKFRGWLCDRCNRVLGLLKDDSSLFRKLANYLDEFNGKVDRERAE